MQWNDIIFGGDCEDLPCILNLEKEDMRLRVLEDSDQSGPVGYILKLYTFSELREEWQLVGTLGDFDLHTVISLLLEAATELYHLRGISSPPQPPVEE